MPLAGTNRKHGLLRQNVHLVGFARLLPKPGCGSLDIVPLVAYQLLGTLSSQPLPYF